MRRWVRSTHLIPNLSQALVHVACQLGGVLLYDQSITIHGRSTTSMFRGVSPCQLSGLVATRYYCVGSFRSVPAVGRHAVRIGRSHGACMLVAIPTRRVHCCRFHIQIILFEKSMLRRFVHSQERKPNNGPHDDWGLH